MSDDLTPTLAAERGGIGGGERGPRVKKHRDFPEDGTMRIRFFLTVVSASLFAVGFVVQACGNTTNDSPTATDSGADVFEASTPKDTSVPDVADTAPPCDPNKDILSGIMDASIADGASSVGVCLGCASAKCSTEINECKMDCDCQGIAGGALECFAKSMGSQSATFACVAPFATAPKSAQTIGLALANCVQSSCAVECQTKQFMDAGADAEGGT
jgi:hypothetical protein